MSKVSDVYDALVTRVSAVLPTHKRLSDPNFPEANPEKDLVKGWGIAFGPGENTAGTLTNIMSVRRQFVIIVSRKVQKRDTDAVGRATVEKQLFEDQKLIIADVEGEPTLGNSDAVCVANYTSDGGIEFVHADKDNFLKLETVIEIEYREDLN